MRLMHEVHVSLMDKHNRTVVGSFVIERLANGDLVTPTPQPNTTHVLEKDPTGAGSYVIAVVLIYGLSIVFLIGSHVFIKKKEMSIEGEEKKVDHFLENSYHLQEMSNREAYKNLKKSIVPIVAASPARHLISRRKSFLPFLASAGIQLADPGGILSGLQQMASQNNENSEDKKGPLGVPLGPRRCSLQTGLHGMPIIGEEDEEVSNAFAGPQHADHSTGQFKNEHNQSATENIEVLVHSSGNRDKRKLSTPQQSVDSNVSSCSSRSSGIDQLAKARNYLTEMMNKQNMVPARKNMYKLVWTSEDRSSYGSPRTSIGSIADQEHHVADVHLPPAGRKASPWRRYSQTQYSKVPSGLSEDEEQHLVSCV